MSEFERELPSFRLAQIHHGDDLAVVEITQITGLERGHQRWLKVPLQKNFFQQ